uniref:Uncharacterized protein n=1 Tax=Heterorhabditis bacteriophora TaxID=37862 RepID=A0A1I7WF18_HETBA
MQIIANQVFITVPVMELFSETLTYVMLLEFSEISAYLDSGRVKRGGMKQVFRFKYQVTAKCDCSYAIHIDLVNPLTELSINPISKWKCEENMAERSPIHFGGKSSAVALIIRFLGAGVIRDNR